MGLDKRCLALAGVGAGMLAFGARLYVAKDEVSWAPYLDQWHAELSGVVAPIAHGTLVWRSLIAGNNEHRVFLTRMLCIAVVFLNGAWDNRPLVVANYLLDSLLIAWVCTVAWRFLGWARGSLVGAAAVLPMFLVCEWEGIVSSNQTQFIFMSFGSVLALSMKQQYKLKSAISWATLAIAFVTLGSMASGFLTALALMTTAIIVAHVRRLSWIATSGFCVLCVAISVFAWLTRVEFTALYSIYASGFGSWFKAFIAYASWPMPQSILGFLCMWLPWCVLLFRTLRYRQMEPLAPFAIGLGIWAILQSCALAWARAGLSGLVGSRYTEFLSWAFVANAVAIVLLSNTIKRIGRIGRFIPWLVIAIWLACVGGWEIWRSDAIYRPYFDAFRAQTLEHEQRLGSFMRTGDPKLIEGVAFPHVPYINSDVMISLLHDPKVQVMLPGPLRRDLVRENRPYMIHSIQDGPLVVLAVSLLQNGLWFALTGLVFILTAALWIRRQLSKP